MGSTQSNIPPPMVRQVAVNPPPSCWEKNHRKGENMVVLETI